MPTHRRKPNRKPSVKANASTPPKLDYSNTCRNINTLRKLEKAIQDEKEKYCKNRINVQRNADTRKI